MFESVTLLRRTIRILCCYFERKDHPYVCDAFLELWYHLNMCHGLSSTHSFCANFIISYEEAVLHDVDNTKSISFFFLLWRTSVSLSLPWISWYLIRWVGKKQFSWYSFVGFCKKFLFLPSFVPSCLAHLYLKLVSQIWVAVLWLMKVKENLLHFLICNSHTVITWKLMENVSNHPRITFFEPDGIASGSIGLYGTTHCSLWVCVCVCLSVMRGSVRTMKSM